MDLAGFEDASEARRQRRQLSVAAVRLFDRVAVPEKMPCRCQCAVARFTYQHFLSLKSRRAPTVFASPYGFSPRRSRACRRDVGSTRKRVEDHEKESWGVATGTGGGGSIATLLSFAILAC